jgi:plastocyanin
MVMGRKRMLAGGVFVLALVGAACSNYGGANGLGGATTTPAPASSAPATTAPASSPPATTAPPATTGVSCPTSAGKASLTQKGIAFQPTKFSAASCTTVTVTNKDATTHTFTIDNSPVNVHVPPGASVEADLALPPGTYTYYCTIHGLSMSGKVTVT